MGELAQKKARLTRFLFPSPFLVPALVLRSFWFLNVPFIMGAVDLKSLAFVHDDTEAFEVRHTPMPSISL